MKRLISLIVRFNAWNKRRKIRRYIRKVRKMWNAIEWYMAVAQLPRWKKKQIRKDMIEGNTTFLETKE